MTYLINEEITNIDGRSKITQYFSDQSKVEIVEHLGKIKSRKEITSKGTYITYNGDNIKIEELTAEGTVIKYNPKTQKKIEEKHKDGTTITFHENENISRIETKDKTFCYYDNNNLAYHYEENYELHKDKQGNIQYELKDDDLYINPDYFSYYRLGIKDRNATNHWSEKALLDPKKKTLVFLGGSETKDAKAANGNINGWADILGLTSEQISSIQLCSCYRPVNLTISYLLRRTGRVKKQINDDYHREILQKFMPFMAKTKDNKLVKYTGEELASNFRNIMIQAHCAGANDLVKFTKIFNETLTQLGYTDKEKTNAMRQIICITNNTQRELTDNLSFTTIHRYSVQDGQFEPEYDQHLSDAHPIFLATHKSFLPKKGIKSGFINLKNNEMLMVFDKILANNSKRDEHNAGFWTTKKEKLTTIGKLQAKLMMQIGQFWFNNHEDIPSVEEVVLRVSKGTITEKFVSKALEFGRKLKTEQRNPLKNHHILKKISNEYKDTNIIPEKIGIFKALSEYKKKMK